MARSIIVAGCACAGCYQSGQIINDARWHQDRATVVLGCVDLAVSVGGDPEVTPDDPVVRVWFGNRCHRSVPLDFTRLRVDGFAIVDPRGEVHAGELEANAQGHEALELAPSAGGTAAHDPLCVDLSGVVPDAPAPAPICFRIVGAHYMPASGGVS
jgi:hypothetical protein